MIFSIQFTFTSFNSLKAMGCFKRDIFLFIKSHWSLRQSTVTFNQKCVAVLFGEWKPCTITLN